MKLKLFDETEISIKSASESNSELIIQIPLEKKSDYADIFENITDSNLSAVTITNGSEVSTYDNLKFASASLITGSKYTVVLTLSNKSEFEMKVTEFEKELTATQTALVELYEATLL